MQNEIDLPSCRTTTINQNLNINSSKADMISTTTQIDKTIEFPKLLYFLNWYYVLVSIVMRGWAE